MNQIRLWNYGNYSNDNYGSSRGVTIGSLNLYFSYDTVVAFKDGGNLVIRQNDWKQTTGKHLNAINPDKKVRISGEQFEKQLGEVLKKHNLTV